MVSDLSAWPLQSISWVSLGNALKKIMVEPLASLVLVGLAIAAFLRAKRNVFVLQEYAKTAHVLQEQVKF